MLVQQIIAQIKDLMRRCGFHIDPQSGLCYYSGYGDDIFSCEAYYDTIALSHMGADETLALNTLRVYLRSAHEDGHIPRHCLGPLDRTLGYPWGGFEEEEHAQPFLWQMALLISRARGNAEWLSPEEYTRLRRYLDRWLTDWDRDGNGLSEWASAPHAMADTAFDRAGVWRSYFCEGVDLNCYLYLEFLAAEALARALNLEEDAAYFAGHARKKQELIQATFWDDKDGFFYDRDIRSGEPIKVKAAEGFMPLWARIATPEQARRLVEEHLTNPQEFWTPYPIPTYARSEPSYTQYHQPPPGSDPLWYLAPGHCNWQGGLWPHMNYMITHGLVAYGYCEEAMHIARRSLEIVAADPLLHEWYNAETGEGQGSYPFWAGVEVLMGFLCAEIQAGFDPSKIEAVGIRFESDQVRRELGLESPATGWSVPV